MLKEKHQRAHLPPFYTLIFHFHIRRGFQPPAVPPPLPCLHSLPRRKVPQGESLLESVSFRKNCSGCKCTSVYLNCKFVCVFPDVSKVISCRCFFLFVFCFSVFFIKGASSQLMQTKPGPAPSLHQMQTCPRVTAEQTAGSSSSLQEQKKNKHNVTGFFCNVVVFCWMSAKKNPNWGDSEARMGMGGRAVPALVRPSYHTCPRTHHSVQCFHSTSLSSCKSLNVISHEQPTRRKGYNFSCAI